MPGSCAAGDLRTRSAKFASRAFRRSIASFSDATPCLARVSSNGASSVCQRRVWPIVAGEHPGVRTFSGHTDTVLDIVGRIGTPPSLVIFTEGNHLMALLSKDIVGAFPGWARTQPPYAHLNVDNVVVVTMPQPIVVQMIRTGTVALGNLTLDLSRSSGLYPDIVMSGPDPQRELRQLGVIEPQARYFSKNRRFWLRSQSNQPSASRAAYS